MPAMSFVKVQQDLMTAEVMKVFSALLGTDRAFRDARLHIVFPKNSYEKCKGVLLFIVESSGRPLRKIMNIVT